MIALDVGPAESLGGAEQQRFGEGVSAVSFAPCVATLWVRRRQQFWSARLIGRPDATSLKRRSWVKRRCRVGVGVYGNYGQTKKCGTRITLCSIGIALQQLNL